MKKCYCCGADVPDQSKFCPKCGKPMAVTRDLIDRAMENDPEAQTELYERTYKTVYSRIRAKVPDEDTAMDIMQETYLRAFTGLDQLQKPETFPSWLLSIASRQVCDWYRKNGKENENVQMSQLEYENDDTISDEDDLLDQPEFREDFSPDESLDRAETGRLLSEILDTLPEDQRIILTMRYYDELSLKEISEELGLNINTVKTRLTAAKKKVEAKVLDLEKSGTKLYSLGPMAFLVFLLHHAELFAPAISANTIIGLTAAGAGAGGAAATAAHVTAATAAKTAVAAAAKGISVKAVAIVAAAVVVVGGGVTAGVVVANNSNHQETAAVSETVEQPSETPEPSESVEPIVIEPPSDDTVMEIAGDLDKWIANSDLGTEPINLDLNTACQLAAVMISECGYAGDDGVTRAGVGDYDGYKSVISEEALNRCLHDLFGSGYQASDFQNTETTDLIQSVSPDYSTDLSGYLIRDENGDLGWYYTGLEDGYADAVPAEVIGIFPVEGDDETYTATVRYDWYIPNETGGEDILKGSSDITFRLKYDEGSQDYWTVVSLQAGAFVESEEYQEYLERQISEAVYAMVEPLSFWIANVTFPGYPEENSTVGKIYMDTNRAVELAGLVTDGYIDNEEEYYSFYLPEDALNASLKKMFGSQYQLSDFTNTTAFNGAEYYVSAFSSEYPNYAFYAQVVYRTEDGKFYKDVPGMGTDSGTDNFSVKEINRNDDSTCTATVEYVIGTGGWGSPTTTYSMDVQYDLIPDESAEYGWAITAITFGDKY